MKKKIKINYGPSNRRSLSWLAIYETTTFSLPYWIWFASPTDNKKLTVSNMLRLSEMKMVNF